MRPNETNQFILGVLMKLKKSSIFIISSVFFISSCGGGGGGGSAVIPNPLAQIISFVASLSSSPIGGSVDISWSSSDASSCSASGSWSGVKSTSGKETITINSEGANTFNLTCSGTGGSSGLSSLSVEGYKTIAGVAVDGYISNASIFVDKNDNFVLDSDESSVSSGTNGDFTIRYDNGMLISLGGVDLDSQNGLDNLLLTNTLTGHTDTVVITPITSLASYICTNTEVECSGDGASINTLLGIDTSINVNTFDPVANKGDTGINDYLYEKGNQITAFAYVLQNITNDLNSSTETTQDYFKAIAQELDLEYSSTGNKIDIENPIFISNVFENVISAKSLTISDDSKSNTIMALSSVLPIIQVKASDDLTTSIIRFATGTMQIDLVKLANGTQPDEMINWYSSAGITSYMATSLSISSDGLDPIVASLADSATTAEDTSVTLNVLANDSYQTSLPVTLTAGAASSGSISILNNVVTYSPNDNFNGSDSFTYTLVQNGSSTSSTVSIAVSSVNDNPVINTASVIDVANAETNVGVISISDVDGDSLTLSLSGTDADSFNLSEGNVLSFKTASNYETKNSYSITLTVSDGVTSITKDITISIIQPRVIGYEVLKSIDVIETQE